MHRQEVVVFLWQKSHVGSPINEWADIKADAAAREEWVTPVVRLPSSIGSLVYAMPRKSGRAWAAPLAVSAVQRRLAAATSNSELRDEYDLPPSTLDEATQRTCNAMLAER